MECRDCKHAAHEAGQCKSCNCGESQISRLTSRRELTGTGPNSFNGSTLGRYVNPERVQSFHSLEEISVALQSLWPSRDVVLGYYGDEQVLSWINVADFTPNVLPLDNL